MPEDSRLYHDIYSILMKDHSIKIVEAVEKLQPSNLRGIRYVCEIFIRPNHSERTNNGNLISRLKKAWACFYPQAEGSISTRLKKAGGFFLPEKTTIDWIAIEKHIADGLRQKSSYTENNIIPYNHPIGEDGRTNALCYMQIVGQIPRGLEILVHSNPILLPAIIFDPVYITDHVIVTKTPYFTKGMLGMKELQNEKREG